MDAVSGGQISQNRGNTFAEDVGLLGVTTDPRDMGFPSSPVVSISFHFSPTDAASRERCLADGERTPSSSRRQERRSP
jgi:hypothetical protein